MGIAEDVAAWVASNWDLDMTLRQWWARLSAAGLAFPTWPEGLGGRGWRPSQAREVLVALGGAGVIGPPAGNAPNMGAPTLLAHGTPEQKERFVRPVADGTEAWCQLFSEPGAGSDLAGLRTRAERDGDEYVVNGQKVWNSRAESSEWGMLLARTNPDVPKHAGITWMMVDMRQPGVVVRPLVQMNGGAEFCEVFLTDARVPVQNVVGDVGDGWNVARTTLAHERGSIGQQQPRGLLTALAGSMPGHLDRTVRDLVETARRLATDPNRRSDVMVGSKSMIRLAKDVGKAADLEVRQRVADYWIRSEVHRLTGLRSRDNAKGGKPGPEASILKLSTAALAHLSRDLSLSIAWALFALLLLVFGTSRKLGALRWVSLFLLLATIGKVFLLDLEDLAGLYRVGSFLGLALSLLVVSLLYQRFVFRKPRPEGS